MAIRYWHDLYPADDPRDGTRVVRFTHHQKAHYEHVRNGAGSGLVELRGTTSDAQLIAPTGMQYVRVVEENTVAATETVRGGYFLEEGDFLALDRKRLKKLQFGGTGTLSYLDREVMWSHSYAHGIVSGFVPQDPFDGIWRLWNQGDAMGGDKLGAILWRVIKEGQAYRSGATYTHRHATGDEFNVEFTDAHDDDKLETAIPFVTLGFDQFTDSSGNAWSVGSGEFEAQVGESLFEVTKRLMEAGLYVELDPDTFELRAWEVANHGRDRTGLAWGANVVRFEPPPPPSTDRAEGNILNDLKRALKPFIKVTAVLAGGGEDTYAVATASGVVPWHRFRPLDINDTTALSAAATRDITRRNDAGDTVLVRSKVGNDPANGYYLPEEHAKLDDLVTVHSGTDTWDWDEAAYPIAKWSVTSRRTGAPDVFYHLGASYHAGASKEFAGGAGVGRHNHPPNPRLCVPGAASSVTIQSSDPMPASASGVSRLEFGYERSGGTLVPIWDTATDATPTTVSVSESVARWFLRVHQTGGTFVYYSDDPDYCDVTAAGSITTLGWEWTRDFVTGGLDWNDTIVEITGSPSSGDGHPLLIGTGPRAKRCSDTEHFFFDRAPSTSDNRSAGFRYGTHWVWVDDMEAPTESFGSWMLIDAEAGTWIQIGAGTHPDLATHDALGLATDADLTAHTTDATDAHDASAISIADAGGHFTGTDVEAALQELGAVGGGPHDHDADYITRTDATDDVTTVAASGAAHTIENPTANVQDITLTANATFTMPPVSDGKSFTVRLRQDGTGGRTATFTDVEWPGGTAPTLSTDPNAVDFLTFHSDGSVWYGAYDGASTGAHDHDADYSAIGHTHSGGSGGGEILIADSPAGSPLVFADLLQNEAGTDLLYEG